MLHPLRNAISGPSPWTGAFAAAVRYSCILEVKSSPLLTTSTHRSRFYIRLILIDNWRDNIPETLLSLTAVKPLNCTTLRAGSAAGERFRNSRAQHDAEDQLKMPSAAMLSLRIS
jgi:hypothetical protein